MDSNKKQTAVEFLAEKYNYVTWLRNRDEISAGLADEWRKHYLEQAKELENQQHEETSTHMVSYAIYCISNLKESDFEKKFEQYYNETYGGE